MSVHRGAAAAVSQAKGGERMRGYLARVPSWAWTVLAVVVVLNVLFWSWD
jgi:hypothetical protein